MYTTSNQQTETFTKQTNFPLISFVSVQKHNFLFCAPAIHLANSLQKLYDGPLIMKVWIPYQLCVFSFLHTAVLIPGPRWNPAALNIPSIDSQVTLVLHNDQHDSGMYEFKTFSGFQHVIQLFSC